MTDNTPPPALTYAIRAQGTLNKARQAAAISAETRDYWVVKAWAEGARVGDLAAALDLSRTAVVKSLVRKLGPEGYAHGQREARAAHEKNL